MGTSRFFYGGDFNSKIHNHNFFSHKFLLKLNILLIENAIVDIAPFYSKNIHKTQYVYGLLRLLMKPKKDPFAAPKSY